VDTEACKNGRGFHFVITERKADENCREFHFVITELKPVTAVAL